MFGLPDAKRVCRADLHSPAFSRSASPSNDLPDTRAIDALRNVLSLDTFDAPEDTQNTNHLEHINNDESAEQEFEFRLFRAPARKDAATTSSTKPDESHNNDNGVQRLKLRLRSPTPAPAGEGGFVVPFRGWDYYLSDPEAVMRALNSKKVDEGVVQSRTRQEFLDVAVRGEDVVSWARTSWPGRHLPWRVIHLAKSSAPKSSQGTKRSETPALVSATSPPEKKKKSKPGKKRRIVMRQRLASKKVEEEADKEKRNKRNREKKIKRRQRERDKKAATKVEGIPGEETQEVGGSGDECS